MRIANGTKIDHYLQGIGRFFSIYTLFFAFLFANINYFLYLCTLFVLCIRARMRNKVCVRVQKECCSVRISRIERIEYTKINKDKPKKQFDI